MKIVHLADSHLGFSAYSRVDKWGRNLREEMVYQGFKEAVDKIIEINPDAVVHAGDVFHHVRPKIRPLYVFKQNLERLIDAEIPVIIISGNHDAPKSFSAVSPFKLFEGMDGICIAHSYQYERFDVGGYSFHCIPFCLNSDDYLKQFQNIHYSGSDVLVMHGMVEALWDKRLRTVGEHELKDSFLKRDFSYIALGHYHGQAQIANNAWYSGSIEYFRFGEEGDDKGMLLVDLDKGLVEPIQVKDKNMFDLPAIECDGFSSEDLLKELQSKCDEVGLENNIVRIKLNNVSREAYKNINLRGLGQLKSMAVHLEVMPNFKEEKNVWKSEAIEVERLPREFEKFLKDESSSERIAQAIKDEVISYGTDLIKRAAETRTTEVFDAPK